MGLVKEPKNIDLTIQSTPWTKAELAELSAIIKKTKAANKSKSKTQTASSPTK